MSIERILHQGTPTPRGPYSSAVRAGDFIFVSGLGPVDDNDQYAFGDIQQQTRQTLLNLTKILTSCGARLADYKVPDFITIQTEPLPRNPTGKLLKAPLREIARTLAGKR